MSLADRKQAKVGDKIDVKCDKKHPITKQMIWKTLIVNKGHQFYIKKTWHELTSYIKLNPPPFGLEPGIKYPDDPELTAHTSVNEIIYSQGKTAKRTLDYVNRNEQQDLMGGLDVVIDDEVMQTASGSSCPVISGEDVGDVFNEMEYECDQSTEMIEEENQNKSGNKAQKSTVQSVVSGFASSTPAGAKKLKVSRGKVITPEQVKALVVKRQERTAVESLSEVVDSLRVSVDTMNHTMVEFKQCVSGLANRNIHEVQQFGTCMKNLVGVLLLAHFVNVTNVPKIVSVLCLRGLK